MPRPKCLFWISGNLRSCRKSWNSLCEFIKEKSESDLNIETIHCGFNSYTTPPDQRLASVENVAYRLRSKDMFDNRPRVVRIVGIPEDYKDLIPHLGLASTKLVVVFWGNPGYYRPGSKRWNSIKTTKLYKTVKTEGKIFESPVEAKTATDAIRWLREACKEDGIKIDPEALKAVVELEGLNLDILDNVVQKLAVYESKKTISLADVEECCRKNIQKAVWSYLSCLDGGRYDSAMEFLQWFYEVLPGVGESFYGRVNQLFGAIKQHFLFLMAAKDACPEHLKVKDVEEALSAFKKSTPTELRKLADGELTEDDLKPIFTSGYIYNQLNSGSIKQVFSWKKKRVYEMLADVYVCMFLCRYRSGDDSYIKLCLDTFTMFVCGKISMSQAFAVRGYKVGELF